MRNTIIRLARITVAAAVAAAAAACTTPARQAPSFATSFDVPESDGILIDWRECVEPRPCMTGRSGARAYRLAFHDSPAVVTGVLGDRKLRLEIVPDSVYRLGDHGIELLYTDRAGVTLELTWNELDQKPIDHQLIAPASD